MEPDAKRGAEFEAELAAALDARPKSMTATETTAVKTITPQTTAKTKTKPGLSAKAKALKSRFSDNFKALPSREMVEAYERAYKRAAEYLRDKKAGKRL